MKQEQVLNKIHKEILPPQQADIYPLLKQFTNQGYVLFGGTALALQLGHRQSVDFDFFAADKMDKKFFQNMENIHIQNMTAEDDKTFCFLTTTGVHVSCFGEIDFVKESNTLLTPDGTIRIADIPSLLVTKLKSMLQRADIKDYRDIIAILRSGQGNLRDALDRFLVFFPQTDYPVMQIPKALTYFQIPELAELTQNEKDFLVQHVNNLVLPPKSYSIPKGKRL